MKQESKPMSKNESTMKFNLPTTDAELRNKFLIGKQSIMKNLPYRGVKTVPFDSEAVPNEEINQRAVQELQRRNVVKEGDIVLITKGDYVNAQGGTNTMKIVRVGPNIK